MTRLPHRARPAAAALVAVALVAGSAPAATAGGGGTPKLPAAAAPSAPSTSSARDALAAAQALLSPRSSLLGQATAAGQPRDATLLLRDLAVSLPSLSRADRASAEALLARPSQDPDPDGIVTWGGTPEQQACSATLPLCVHWTTSGSHAPSPADTNPANGIPDWVDHTLAESERVWGREVTTLGYKQPLPDTSSSPNGGGSQLDIYLADVGALSLYGYCTSDDPKLDRPLTPARRGVSAYCVVDNDYTGFPAHSPLENLRVTVAHEFFHAVQFAYDFYEDRWLMEATATWVEDVVYDAIDDNRQYLDRSPLAQPGKPLDLGGSGYQYGAWIFFRYLSERYGDSIIRGIWQRADDTPDQVSTNDLSTYSLRAIDATLRMRGTSLAIVFGSFAAANTTPKRFYQEGKTYPRLKRLTTFRLSRANPSTGWLYTDLDHLAARPLQVKRGPGVAPSAKVRVTIDAPKAKAQPQARLVVRYADGRAKIVPVALDRLGDGAATVAFGSPKVASVLVVLSNASSRYRSCWAVPYGGLSCWRGVPVDDGRRFFVAASLR